VADRIPNATFVEVPGNDDVFAVGDIDSVLDEIEAFLTGSRPSHEPRARPGRRDLERCVSPACQSPADA
jgi:thiamine pyrophosphokinase